MLSSNDRRRRPVLMCSGLIALGAPGCQTVREVALVPLEVAQYVAVETVKLSWEAAKLGVGGVIDAASGR